MHESSYFGLIVMSIASKRDFVSLENPTVMRHY